MCIIRNKKLKQFSESGSYFREPSKTEISNRNREPSHILFEISLETLVFHSFMQIRHSSTIIMHYCSNLLEKTLFMFFCCNFKLLSKNFKKAYHHGTRILLLVVSMFLERPFRRRWRRFLRHFNGCCCCHYRLWRRRSHRRACAHHTHQRWRHVVVGGGSNKTAAAGQCRCRCRSGGGGCG